MLSFASLLMVGFLSFDLSYPVNAKSGPTVDRELFLEYKQTHSGNGAFIEKYTKAMNCLEHGQHKTAIRLFKDLSKEDPKCPGIWVSLSTCYLWLEDYQNGAEAATHAIALRPKDPDMYRRRALHFVALLKYKEAIADLDQGVKVDPHDSEVLTLRASCLKAVKRYADSLADYDKLLKAFPRDETNLYAKTRVYSEMKDWKNAVLTLDKICAYYPSDENALLERARCKMQLKDFKGAVQDYSKALSLGTESQEYVLNERASAYDKLGMQKEAKRDRDKANAGSY
jgi:tetratricopeptide (TPR) repeat protein